VCTNPGKINFVQYYLEFLGLQHETCLVTIFIPAILGWLLDFWKMYACWFIARVRIGRQENYDVFSDKDSNIFVWENTRVVGVWPQCLSIPLSANSGPFLPTVHLLWVSVNKHARCYLTWHSVKSHISGHLWTQFVNFKQRSPFCRLWWFLSNTLYIKFGQD
jgi:hypothetical protein